MWQDEFRPKGQPPVPQSLVHEGSDLQVARLSAFSNSSCTALLLAEGFRINPVPVMPATVFSDACMSHARQRRMFFPFLHCLLAEKHAARQPFLRHLDMCLARDGLLHISATDDSLLGSG